MHSETPQHPPKTSHIPKGEWHPIPCVHHGEAITDKASEDAGKFPPETYALLWHTQVWRAYDM